MDVNPGFEDCFLTFSTFVFKDFFQRPISCRCFVINLFEFTVQEASVDAEKWSRTVVAPCSLQVSVLNVTPS